MKFDDMDWAPKVPMSAPESPLRRLARRLRPKRRTTPTIPAGTTDHEQQETT